MSRAIVVGGGAAGMMAAYACAASGHRVTLLEKNEKLGKKIFITGKGRCNVTNVADREQFFKNIVSNSKFLYSSVHRFDSRALISFLEQYGCPVKTERGGRVFPVSDHAFDVTDALRRAMKEKRVEVRLHAEVKALLSEEKTDDLPKKAGTEDVTPDDRPQKKRRTEQTHRQIRGVLLSDGTKMEADAVILACGGLSYPSTGSDGAGFRLAAQAGHSLTPCFPALVPFEIKEDWCRELQGLSLKNVEIRLMEEGGTKPLYSGFGEMLFTHFGVSGPLVLTASSYYSKLCRKSCTGKDETDKKDKKNVKNIEKLPSVKLFLNVKPAMDEETLDKRLLREFEENGHRAFKNSLGRLFPAKLLPVMAKLSGIDGEKRAHEVTKEERLSFARLIQNVPLTVTGTRGFSEAVITQGGIPVSEVNPSTMESKLCKGLYLAGEMLDIDALTGGYNLQLAWSTGYLAGASVV